MQEKKTSAKKPAKQKTSAKQKTNDQKPKVAENEDKSKNKSRKPLIISCIIGAALILIVGVTLFFLLRKDSDINTTKIMSKLSGEIASIKDITNFSEANDPNGVLGQENQYSSKSSWEDSRLAEHASEYAGTIEVFDNAKDAELREWKLNRSAEACDMRFTIEKYGSAFKEGANCKSYLIIRKNTVVYRLSADFTEDQVNDYKTKLDKIIDGFVVPDKNTPSAERISELRKETEDTLDATLDETEKDVQKGMDEILQQYEDTLDAIAVSLNEDELAEAKETLSFFKEASYFSSKIAGLEKKISDIETKIAESKRQAEETAAREAQEKLAQKNKRLGSGKYTACTDVDSGTYDVTAVSGSGNLYVNSSNLNHYVNELMDVNGSYGWNKEYKNMVLSCGDVLEIKNGLTVQITAKR